MDRVFINELRILAIIGTHPHERIQPQDIIVSLTCYLQKRCPYIRDDINDCVNYQTLSEEVTRYVQESKKQTVDALAEGIAKLCLANKAIMNILVRVEKPQALPNARSAGVEIERSNK